MMMVVIFNNNNYNNNINKMKKTKQYLGIGNYNPNAVSRLKK